MYLDTAHHTDLSIQHWKWNTKKNQMLRQKHKDDV